MKINWLWDTTLAENRIRDILQDIHNPRFYIYAEKLFSRTSDPKVAFDYIHKEVFVKEWPLIKKRIEKDAWAKGKVAFWQKIYNSISKKANRIDLDRLSVAQQIKNLRIKLGYSQGDLAKKMGVIQQYISRIESGKENVSIDNLKRIAEALNRRLVIKLR